MVSLISDGLKLEFAAGDPAGGLTTKSTFLNMISGPMKSGTLVALHS